MDVRRESRDEGIRKGMQQGFTDGSYQKARETGTAYAA